MAITQSRYDCNLGSIPRLGSIAGKFMVKILLIQKRNLNRIEYTSSNDPETSSRDFAFQRSKHWQLKLFVNQCHLECGHLSNLNKWKDNRHYQLAKSLGPDTVAACLRQMRCRPSWIHIMLLTDWVGPERPIIASENYGKFKKIVETWLSWGLERGYIK